MQSSQAKYTVSSHPNTSLPSTSKIKSSAPDLKEATSTTQLLPRLSLLNCVAMTVGMIIGSGIFVSPTGVLIYTGSPGLALVVWVCCGVVSGIGAMTYLELATTFGKSGSEFLYLKLILGKLPAFLYLWTHALLSIPASVSIVALTFAKYAMEPVFRECQIPPILLSMISALLLTFLVFVNCHNVEWATKIQTVFTAAKIISLLSIIGAGIYQMIIGNSELSSDIFKESTTDPGHIALAFYFGLFAFSGWEFSTIVVEEIREPLKILPRTVWISLPLVTTAYVLTNVAYFTVLQTPEIIASNAVAVTFGEKFIGGFSWIVSLFVAISVFGCLNSSIFGCSRVLFIGSREGHLPHFFSMINVQNFTPVPSLIFLSVLCLLYMTTSDIFILLNYATSSQRFFIALLMAGMIWKRYKEPDLPRPIKVNILFPVIYMIICLALVVLPFYVNTVEMGISAAVVIAGIPIYYLTIFWTEKPELYKRIMGKITATVQKLFLSVPEEKKE